MPSAMLRCQGGGASPCGFGRSTRCGAEQVRHVLSRLSPSQLHSVRRLRATGAGSPGCRHRPRGRAASHASAVTEGMSGIKAALAASTDLKPPPAPPISRSDEAFAVDGVEFVTKGDELDIAQLNDLFEKVLKTETLDFHDENKAKVGFPQRDPVRMRLALKHSHAVVWVRCTRGSRWARLGQLLAFARATSDTALSATIWDVAVNPSWQRTGLGRAMLERLIGSLVAEDIGTITLYAEANVVGLYEKLSFVQDPQGIKGMAFQRTSRAGKILVAASKGSK